VFLVVARLAGVARGFGWVFGVYYFDHRHHPVVLVVEDVAVEHEHPVKSVKRMLANNALLPGRKALTESPTIPVAERRGKRSK
jgi:hypothetical protein